MISSERAWVLVSLLWYFIHLQWRALFFLHLAHKRCEKFKSVLPCFYPRHWGCQVCFYMFKWKKLSLVQSKTSASLTNSKHTELFEPCFVCLWELTWFTAFFVNIILSIQGENMCAGSIGSTFCTFYFVPYRLKENVGFAYESMGLLGFKKKPRIIMYTYKYCMWSKCYGSHLWWNMYVFPRIRPS